MNTFDVDAIRNDFPILKQCVHGRPLVYLDNAATTQKPQEVIDAIVRYYTETNANIHRGVHLLSEKATKEHEDARKIVKRFLNASSTQEIVFVRGCTEAINLVADSWGSENLGPGDEILVSNMEHHSNIVPWQLLCQRTGAVLKVIPIDDAGDLLMDEYQKLLGPRTKIVSVVHLSNALGTINPVREITRLAHEAGARVLIDGAQSVPHIPVDVQDIGCDFFAFSGHKIYGPTGIGVLYGKRELLEAMRPYQGGGDMISSVTFEETTYNALPYKFEAGTPNIEGAIALGTAIEYVERIGLEAIAAHERDVLEYGAQRLLETPGVTLIGTSRHKASILSFVLEGVHPHDVGTILDQEGVAIRTGHHCVQPVMKRYGIPATARVSLACYNTRGEIDALVAGLKKVVEIFS
ncbi:MAG: cysteine desulfurase [Capsulimonadaceae bacterium]|nr:cysteine desulfurase [Capsulimonadaceae bacterium]